MFDEPAPLFASRCRKLVSDQVATFVGTIRRRHKFPSLYPIALSHSRTWLARKR